MHYGTFKSEVWAHSRDVGQEYFRYEIITRYWLVDEAAGFAWKTTVLSVGHDGSVTDVLRAATEDPGGLRGWWADFAAKTQVNMKAGQDDPARFHADRTRAYQEHAEAIRLAAG